MNRPCPLFLLRTFCLSLLACLLVACSEQDGPAIENTNTLQRPISSPTVDTPAPVVTDDSIKRTTDQNEDSTLVPPSGIVEEQPSSANSDLSIDERIEMSTFPHREIASVVWSPDSANLAVINGQSVWLYDMRGDQVTGRKLADAGVRVSSVAFSSAGEQLAVGLADGRIQLWGVESGEIVTRFSGHDAPVQSLAFNSTDTLLASGAGQWHAEFVPRAEGVEARLWDVATGEPRGNLSDDTIVPPVSHLAFSPDGALLVVGQQGHGCASPRCAGGRLRFWLPDTNAITEMVVGHDIVFGDRNRLVAALGQINESGRVQIWDVVTGNRLTPASSVPNGFAYDLALSHDGSTAAVAIGEYGLGARTAYVWDVVTWAKLAVLESGAPIALSADGRLVASSPQPDSATDQVAAPSANWLRLWDVSQEAVIVRLAEVEGTIGQLAFSPDNVWLAAIDIGATVSQLHLIAIPQPMTTQDVGEVALNPAPTATQIAVTGQDVVPASPTPPQPSAPTVTLPPPSPTPPPLMTVTPIQSEPAADCATSWFMDNPPEVCPEGAGLTSFAASQRFERGQMIWVEETEAFYIFFNLGAHPYDNRLVFETLGPFVLAPGASADSRVGEVPPTGLLEPVSGFGLIWRGEVEGLDIDLRQALGWAVEQEYSFQTRIQCQPAVTYSARTCYLQEVDGSAIVLSYHAIAGNVYWRWVNVDG